MQDQLAASETLSAGLIASPAVGDKLEVRGRFHVEHIRDGKVIWEESFDNLVVNAGKHTMMDKLLDLGSAHTFIHMGLKGAGTPVAADVMGSHASWSQLDINTAGRQVPAFAAATGGSKATSSACVFTITTAGPTTVAGVYIVLSGVSGNTSTAGTLFSAGDFSVSRSVVATDVLNVSYSLAL